MKKPTVLMILDGYGLNDRTEGNAVAQAKTPNMDRLMQEYPFVKGSASGLSVGLPEGQMGNSEVGHLNMGAGRIVYQDLTKITKSIEDGDFYDNYHLKTACHAAKFRSGSLHLWGLLSDGGVHSHNTHLYALLELAKKNGLENVYVHCFMDGRDTAPTSGLEFLKELQQKCDEIGVGKIATVTGRYYAMDRDNRWERVKRAYDALTEGIGKHTVICHKDQAFGCLIQAADRIDPLRVIHQIHDIMLSFMLRGSAYNALWLVHSENHHLLLWLYEFAVHKDHILICNLHSHIRRNTVHKDSASRDQAVGLSSRANAGSA